MLPGRACAARPTVSPGPGELPATPRLAERFAPPAAAPVLGNSSGSPSPGLHDSARSRSLGGRLTGNPTATGRRKDRAAARLNQSTILRWRW